MRKKNFIGLLFFLGITLTSTTSNTATKVIDRQGWTCTEFAISVALLEEANGGDYWPAYWDAYNWCVFEYEKDKTIN